MKNERNEMVRVLVGEGKTYAEIGEILGISKQRVQQICARHEIQWQRRTCLSKEQIEAARQLRAQGMYWAQIGETLDVPWINIYRYFKKMGRNS